MTRPARRRPGLRGATIAVRSLRSGLPPCHLRPGLRPSLQIPSGLSTPRAAQDATAPGSGVYNFPTVGEDRLLGILLSVRGEERECAGTPKTAAPAAFFGIWALVRDDRRCALPETEAIGMRAASSWHSKTSICQRRPPARPSLASCKDLPPSPRQGEECQASRPPQRPENCRRWSPVRRWPGGSGASISPRETVGSRRRTRLTKGKSGAKAPDRNRGPAPPGPPPCRASKEVQTPTTTTPNPRQL